MTEENFDDFRVRWENALEAFARGDGTAVETLVPDCEAASFHCFAGDTVKGGGRIAKRMRDEASDLGQDGSVEFEVIQQVLAGDLCFWTGFQTATISISGRPAPVSYRMRVTEIFRKFDGAWKLAHRHADLADGI